jgi:hypothetical protein
VIENYFGVLRLSQFQSVLHSGKRQFGQVCGRQYFLSSPRKLPHIW